MKSALILATLLALPLANLSAKDWPWWRGPNRDGIADPDQTPPVTFSATENVKWTADVPGRGHGSPIVVGDRVYLAAADDEIEKQWVLCYNRTTGKPEWKTTIHEGGFPKKMNSKASNASSSLAWDGERLFISFLHDKAIYTTALDPEGKQIWQTKITDYTLHQGYGSSPAIYKHLVIVSGDNKKGGAICGLNREDGKIVWRQDRPKLPNYPSPIILTAAGKEQVILTGCEKIVSYDPLTGKVNWETEGATTECVTSTITDGERIFTSGGYPKNHVSAIAADGSGKLIWENQSRVYVPSMFVRDGHLYGMMDAGVLVCWNSATGERLWRQRMGKPFTATPVPVGNLVYAASEMGNFYVVEATPKGAKIIAENQLGDQIYATPVIVDGQIFVRAAHDESNDRRVERLYCLANTNKQK